MWGKYVCTEWPEIPIITYDVQCVRWSPENGFSRDKIVEEKGDLYGEFNQWEESQSSENFCLK